MTDTSIQQKTADGGTSPQEVARCARRLAKMHGNNLMGKVAVYSGLGMDYPFAVSRACEADADWACLVAELIPNLSDASDLRNAIAKATERYFEEEE